MKTIISGSLLLMLMLYACNTTKSPVIVATEKSISGINWYLKKIYQPTGNIDISNPNAYIKLDAGKNSAGGKGGCNNFGSKYMVSGQQIDFKDIFSTKMYCEKFQQQEDSFFQQLEKVNRYDVKEGKLLLYRDSELLLEFGK